ncbi:hypothetical protein M8J76_017196 [Diaphorina citri]|nr:hypothetical protein M8J76_017196 [Diaphorina citri]
MALGSQVDSNHSKNENPLVVKNENGETVITNGELETKISPDLNNADSVSNNTDIVSDPETKDTSSSSASENEDKKSSAGDEPEVVIIQDMGFSVKIVCPGVEPFDLQVSSMELAQEIHQVLMDREETCHRTCFSLQLDGNTLDNFAELKSIEGLKEGSVIKVVEEPYTMREARIHVRHVRDLLKACDSGDAFAGTDCASLSYLNVVTSGDILTEKKKYRLESVDCTPPEFIMPGSRDRPLLPLHPAVKETKSVQCLKVLTTSGWNPPPGFRKMHGDLMYMYVRNFATLIKRRGSRHPFERVATPYQLYSWCSPLLEHTIDAIRAEDTFSSKLGYEEHIPGQTRDWNEELQTTRELSRKTLPDRLLRERAIFKVHSDFVAAATRGALAVLDGNVMAINPGEEAKMQMFIWNNIFFSLGFDVRDHYKELGGDAAAFVAPKNDLQGVRVYSAVDLEGLYTLGTVVIDYRGYRVTAQSIIPGILEREQDQSVVYGSVDFGKTVLSHPKYMELLGKAAQQLKILPHSVLNDKGDTIELCSSVECKGIIGNDSRHYILDLLRTFPPDVHFLALDQEEGDKVALSEESVKMGFPVIHRHKLCCLRQELIDSFVESRYMMFIKNAAYHLQQLTLKKQQQQDQQSIPKPELTNHSEASATNDKSTNQKEVCETLSQEKKKEEEEAMEADEAKKIVENITGGEKKELEESTKEIVAKAARAVGSLKDCEFDILEESTKEIVAKAARAVGSLKDCEFDIRFNPDVFSPGVRHVDKEQLRRQRQLVVDAAEFLVTVQIPAFIRECLDHSTAPMDGVTLSEALHSRGINIRYLGKIALRLARLPSLSYLHNIAVVELWARAVKHLFTAYIQQTQMMCLAPASAHFLNCLLCNFQSKNAKKRNKRKGRMNRLISDSTEWATLTTRILWNQIRAELKAYWDYELTCDSVEDLCETYGVHKLTLLRSFCIKTGVQILLREYQLDQKHKLAFFEEDIVNMFPSVKHLNPRATDAYNFYTTGQTKIQQGFLKEGYELISEALNLLNNVYGAMHPEIAQCLRMLARLSYIMGDHAEALSCQQKAVLMSERVNGIDHPYTITEYTHLALYCFANSQVSTALKLLYRARYLATLICGENHPEIALLDSNISLILHASNISLILHAVGEYELSLRFLEKALALNVQYYGSKSLKVAVSYHLVARTQSCMGDFRSALQNEKETYAIYKQQLGEDHEKTRESSDCLRHLTHQAVVLQKKMNEIYSGRGNTGLPPIQIQPPSMGSVLDMLNVINGVLFVQISQIDIENFKAEMEKRASVLDNNNSSSASISSTPTPASLPAQPNASEPTESPASSASPPGEKIASDVSESTASSASLPGQQVASKDSKSTATTASLPARSPSPVQPVNGARQESSSAGKIPEPASAKTSDAGKTTSAAKSKSERGPKAEKSKNGGSKSAGGSLNQGNLNSAPVS